MTRRPSKLFLFVLILVAAAALLLPTAAMAGWTWDVADGGGWTWDGSSGAPADTTPASADTSG
jgi:hypothetical protein